MIDDLPNRLSNSGLVDRQASVVQAYYSDATGYASAVQRAARLSALA